MEISNINDWYESLPLLYQQLLGGIAVILLWEVVRRLLGLAIRYLLTSRTARQEKQERVRALVRSADSVERTEGSVELIFTVLRYLFIGNLLWVLPEVLAPLIRVWEIELLKLFGVVYFLLGLRWIVYYFTLRYPKEEQPTE